MYGGQSSQGFLVDHHLILSKQTTNLHSFGIRKKTSTFLDFSIRSLQAAPEMQQNLKIRFEMLMELPVYTGVMLHGILFHCLGAVPALSPQWIFWSRQKPEKMILTYMKNVSSKEKLIRSLTQDGKAPLRTL